MKIRKVKKTATTTGLVIFITLVSFALGLAQDGAPVGLGYSFGLHHSFPDKAVCLGDYALRLGLIPKPGDSSVSLVRTWNETVVLPSPFPAPHRLSSFAVARPRKISLHLLDSVLLI